MIIYMSSVRIHTTTNILSHCSLLYECELNSYKYSSAMCMMYGENASNSQNKQIKSIAENLKFCPSIENFHIVAIV